ncbi:MAG: hypothetical protein ACFB9M_17310 [Myxococcota bacterium]
MSCAVAAYDPLIDGELRPKAGVSVGFGVQRLQDEFGIVGSVTSPYFFGEHVALRVEGGIGFFPDIRALPDEPDEVDVGALSLYGHVRTVLVLSARLGLAAGRAYAAAGPSFLFLDDQLSSTGTSVGIYGVVGVELFVGDAFRAFPISVFFEIGGTAHDANADIENRVGPPELTDSTIDLPIATGLALAGGLRYSFW